MQVYSTGNFSQRLKEKSILLFFQPALPNESLTSWICRNALSNYVDPNVFVSKWVKTHTALHYDFDLKPNDEVNHWLSYMSPKRSKTEVPALTLVDFVSGFQFSKTRYSALLPNGTTYHQRLYPTQYCPNCLNKVNPYFKIDWKFSLIFGCNDCRCFLETKCPDCGRNTQIMKLKSHINDQFNSINQCSSCYSFLNCSQIKSLTPEQTEINIWVSQILGLDGLTKINSIKASLLIDLCILLTSNSTIGKIVKDYFQIINEPEPFTIMNPICRSKIIEIAKTWIEDFYRITVDINERYGINRKNWNPHIFIPDSTLNP